MKRILLFVFLSLLVLSLPACGNASSEEAEEDARMGSEDTGPFVSIWLPPYLPDQLLAQIQFPEEIIPSATGEDAEIILDVGSSDLLSRWIYVLVAPFSTTAEDVSLRELQDVWQGEVGEEPVLERILVTGDTQAVFEKLWGIASASTVKVVAKGSMLDQAWFQENTWALIPFENLEPRWKVISIDGQSPISHTFSAETYPLSVPFSVIGGEASLQEFHRLIGRSGFADAVPSTNRYADRLTTVILTGVTALTRGTAYLMEQNGMTYPAIDIGETLRTADILHISNEVPFTETCPNPFANPANDAALVFCSQPEYIQLLESIGTDVVELTGDHFRDWGAEAMLATISMYEERGWQYYGGGKNYEDGVAPALFEHNGNKIAFLGCNAKPRGYATASENSPGAVHCDMQRMAEEIQTVLDAGYLPIFTFQHIEYYEYGANENLIPDFHAAADAGAVIVSGSQAHIPHAAEFYKNSFIHYGLGNLFFDQFKESMAQRQATMDEHIIYDGRYISTRLIPIQFMDLARPRLMEPLEREALLTTIFEASGW